MVLLKNRQNKYKAVNDVLGKWLTAIFSNLQLTRHVIALCSVGNI